MNPQLDRTSPQHLRQDSMVKAWIANYQRDNWSKHEDCRRCGWPHSPVTMCGMGSVFGRVRLGGKYAYVDSSNVEHLRQFVETLSTLGFHWRDEVFIARVDGRVVISHIEYFNNNPSVKQWTIPVHEFASIVCAASEQGETSERYHQALAFLQTSDAARLPRPPAPQLKEEKEDKDARVDGVPGSAALGSTASKNEPTRYELKTVSDFYTVPLARRAECLQDFRLWLDLMGELDALFGDIQGVRADRQTFAWIDDGQRVGNLHIGIRSGGGERPPATNAVDPVAQPSGTPTPRDPLSWSESVPAPAPAWQPLETCLFRKPVRPRRCAEMDLAEVHWCGACLMEKYEPERFATVYVAPPPARFVTADGEDAAVVARAFEDAGADAVQIVTSEDTE